MSLRDLYPILICVLGLLPAAPAGAQTVAGQIELSIVVDNPSGAMSISAGRYHTCLIDQQERLQCWGYNNVGQLGDGTTTSRNIPVLVPLPLAVRQVSAGWEQTCAVLVDSSARCWGGNGDGQLGDGTSTRRPAPVTPIGLGSGVRKITSGYQHSCALMENGTVRCWGRGQYGRLGDGTVENRTTPVTVTGLSGVVDVKAGGFHTCALLSGGDVRCWGYNGSAPAGRLGNGLITDSVSTPVTVSGINGGANRISVGFQRSCAGLTAGGARCWGGDGALVPSQIGGLAAPLRSIDSGWEGDLAVTEAGALLSWSAYGSTSPLHYTGSVKQVVTGDDHTCAVLTTGQVTCWGSGSYGKLGHGANTNSTSPVTVSIQG